MSASETAPDPGAVTGSAPGAWRRALLPYGSLVPTLIPIVVFALSMVTIFTMSFRSFTAGRMGDEFTMETWVSFLTSGYYWDIISETLLLALLVTTITILIAWPTAYALTLMESKTLRVVAFVILFSPQLVSLVTRVYGWQLLLGNKGVINLILSYVPGLNPPYALTFNRIGVIIALVHILLAFAVFPIYSVLQQLPASAREAAADLGARPSQVWRRVTLPLSVPGVIAATQIIFTLVISSWATVALMGGGRVNVLANLIRGNMANLNWPMGSVKSFFLMGLALLMLGVFNYWGRRVR